MEINEADEDCKRDNMLQDEQFVIPAADGCHGTEDDPEQGAPGSQASPDKLVLFELNTNVVVWSPCYEAC
jgi:hypothetical protein